MKIAFIIAHKEKNKKKLSGTLKVRSIFLAEVSNRSLLIVVTSFTFLKR